MLSTSEVKIIVGELSAALRHFQNSNTQDRQSGWKRKYWVKTYQGAAEGHLDFYRLRIRKQELKKGYMMNRESVTPATLRPQTANGSRVRVLNGRYARHNGHVHKIL